MKKLKAFFVKLMVNDRLRLKHFSIATAVFFCGYGSLYWVSHQPASLQQEAQAFAILTITLLSFSWALIMQIVYIASKIFR